MNKILKYKRTVFLIIIIVAFFLRFFDIHKNPPSLTWDEAAWGYNAYSLGIDGRDEFGKPFPFAFLESFGDFKPPLYAYLSILPIKIFGLTEFAVRFMSAFLGSMTVLVTYFLVKELFGRGTRQNSARNDAESIALLSAGLLAISPWHILLSRAAFEANVATFFIVLGVLFFLISVQRYKWLIVLSIISFVLSMYTFNTARIVSPLLVFGLMIGKWKEIFNMKKQIIVAGIIGGVIFLPLFLFLLTPQAKLRFHEVNIFSDSYIIQRQNIQIVNDKNAFWSHIIHNRRFAFAVEYLRHYFDHFNPGFLFIKGDGNPKFSIQDVGQMYIWEFPFFVAGILFLIRNREKNWWIIPYWLLIGIAPAATARETPHALRIEATLPTFQILTAYGLFSLLSIIRSKLLKLSLRKIVIAVLITAGVLNFIYFIHNYVVQYPREFSGEWQYGYKQALTYVQSVEQNYNTIYFTEELGRPYIYTLFYSQYDPKKFREEAKIEREVFGFVHVRSFGKYIFSNDLGAYYSKAHKALFVDMPGKVPKNAYIKKKFSLLNGKPALIAYTL